MNILMPFVMDLDREALYEGLLFRRFFACILDYLVVLTIVILLWLAGILSTIITLGFFPWLLILLISVPAVDIIYTSLTLGGSKQSTWGQRIFGIVAIDEWGNKPGIVRAFLFITLYYILIVPTTNLLELVAFLNNRRRTLPDFFAGLVFIRARHDVLGQ